jgi:2'-5' RNA ligase
MAFKGFRARVLLIAVIAWASLAAGRSPAAEKDAASSSEDVIAIDVLLEPDATMVAKAQAANAKLREDYPQGYTLGREQVAHISLLHRYVHEKDLPKIEEALEKVLDRLNPLQFELTATGYTYANWGGVAITTIGVERTLKLDRLQEEVVNAVKPFTAARGTTAAFSTTKELPKVEEEIVSYVQTFVPKASGQKYNPHVTVGVANEDFVRELKAAPFEKFTFKPAGVAIYQLGSYGTAQKKLWQWSR